MALTTLKDFEFDSDVENNIILGNASPTLGTSGGVTKPYIVVLKEVGTSTVATERNKQEVEKALSVQQESSNNSSIKAGDDPLERLSSTSDAESITSNNETSSLASKLKKNEDEEVWQGLEDVPVDDENVYGENLADIYMSLDENTEHYIDMSNGQRLRISLMFVPKFVPIEKIKEKEGVVFLQYKLTVDYILIDDFIEDFGFKARVNIVNDGGMYDNILQRYNCFLFVINLTILSETNSIRLEPMIFEIESIERLRSSLQHEQRYQLVLTDLFTYITEHHSIASVIKMNPDVVRASSYKEVFTTVLDYVKRYVYLNTGLKATYNKTARFTNEVSDLSCCVEASFAKIKQDATIKEALKFIQSECGTAIKTPQEFSDIYATFGDVCLPFMFKEEYADPYNIYARIWDNSDGGNLVETLTGDASVVLKRDFTMRDMYMPFGLAFNTENKVIYESFNPSVIKRTTNLGEVDELTKEEEQYNCLLGRTKALIVNFSERHPDIAFLYKKFKNMVFVSCGENAIESVLIYVNWVFLWFVEIMLNGYNNGGLVSKLVPDFLLTERNIKITKQFVKPFEEANSSVHMLKSEDPVNEALIVLGRIVSSLVLMGTVYNFLVTGNILRRPNEIIKLSRDNTSDIENNHSNDFNTGLRNENYTLLYVTNVSHVFSGPQYQNIINGNVIYDKA